MPSAFFPNSTETPADQLLGLPTHTTNRGGYLTFDRLWDPQRVIENKYFAGFLMEMSAPCSEVRVGATERGGGGVDAGGAHAGWHQVAAALFGHGGARQHHVEPPVRPRALPHPPAALPRLPGPGRHTAPAGRPPAHRWPHTPGLYHIWWLILQPSPAAYL